MARSWSTVNCNNVISFCDEIDKINTNSPIIIHCSAGIGRTGTFCLIHEFFSVTNLILKGSHDIIDTETFSIKNLLLEMRKHRSKLIQTPDQYQFCYTTIIQKLNDIINNNKI